MKKQTSNLESLSWFKNHQIIFDENRFGAMAFMITFQSCIGSIAALCSLSPQNLFLLAICTVFTMGSNTAFIAQAPAKWCLTIFYIGVAANILIISWVSLC
jgi:hypothetical protein